MDHEQYRREIRAHAVKLGFTGGRKRGDHMTFRHPLSDRVVKIEYAPNVSPLINYVRSRKGMLTSEHGSATYKPEPEIVPAKDDPQRTTPSRNYWDDWLVANHDPTMPFDEDGDDNAGKWIVFLRRSYVDDVWTTVRDATIAGRLSFAAKISTRKDRPLGDDLHVLCVYTANADDQTDIMRVRELLRGLGFTRKISYKPNSMTRALEHGSSFSA